MVTKRLTRVSIVFAACGAILASACGLGTSGNAEQSVVAQGEFGSPLTTVPGTPTQYPTPEAEERAEGAIADMIQNIADSRGISWDEANQMLIADGALQEWVESVKDEPAFADFKFEDRPDGTRVGVVAKVRGLEFSQPNRRAEAREVEFVEASISRADFRAKQAELIQAVSQVDAEAVAVAYEAFAELLVVYTTDSSSSAGLAEVREALVAVLGEPAAGLEVEIRVAGS